MAGHPQNTVSEGSWEPAKLGLKYNREYESTHECKPHAFPTQETPLRMNLSKCGETKQRSSCGRKRVTALPPRKCKSSYINKNWEA